jgi:hypothetical protein
MIYLSQMVRRRFSRSYLAAAAAILLMVGAGATAWAALPATTNYQLNSYGFGSGGTAGSSTSNYSLEGLSGEVSSQADSTSTYQLKPGFVETQQASVPTVTLTNPSSYYDKLHFVIGQQSNPADALYALQVCVGSDFTPAGSCSSFLYVKADNTLGATLTTADYQLYSAWGGSGGGNIIGLAPGTTYYVRAKATQGKFTESAYGPSSNAATSAQSISFCLFAGASCGSGSTTSFSGLVAGTPSTSSPSLGVTFDTNADGGGNIYIYSTGKLQSTAVPGGTITSATADLGSAAQGYGAAVASSTALTVQPAYISSGNNVGVLSMTINTILTSSVPVNGGAATINLIAKASNTTPAATDYTDTVTVIAAAQF